MWRGGGSGAGHLLPDTCRERSPVSSDYIGDVLRWDGVHDQDNRVCSRRAAGPSHGDACIVQGLWVDVDEDFGVVFTLPRPGVASTSQFKWDEVDISALACVLQCLPGVVWVPCPCRVNPVLVEFSVCPVLNWRLQGCLAPQQPT